MIRESKILWLWLTGAQNRPADISTWLQLRLGENTNNLFSPLYWAFLCSLGMLIILHFSELYSTLPDSTKPLTKSIATGKSWSNYCPSLVVGSLVFFSLHAQFEKDAQLFFVAISAFKWKLDYRLNQLYTTNASPHHYALQYIWIDFPELQTCNLDTQIVCTHKAPNFLNVQFSPN